MKKVHPAELLGTFQEIRWSNLKEGVVYDFELINFYSAIITKYRSGGYICFAAKVLKDSEIPKLYKGDIVKLDFSYKVFCNAYCVVDPRARVQTLKKNLGNNNVKVCFVKHSQKRLEFLFWEARKASEKDLERADFLVYNNEMFFDEEVVTK